ncbi:MAG: translation initiation factor eIF-2B [Melioribacteraceae bacterium]|nr:translation initiation factor eIF-2B [Melioribacteraceae bacterium]
MNKKFSKLFNDKTSGSFEILFELHNHLKVQSSFLKIFPQFIDSVSEKFPTFENIQKYLNELKKYLKKNQVELFFNKYDELFSNINELIFINAKELNNYTSFLTISNSKTLFEFFVRLKKINKEIQISICESRPKYEGRIFAKKLYDEKINVELITEAMIFNKCKEVDCGIIGADTILNNGNVINKIGSSIIALSCKNFNKPFYVMADKTKIKQTEKFKQKEMPPEEIWRHSYKKIKIKNYYFEEIPKNLITKIITD